MANLGAAEPTYWQDVRPVLRRNCTVCHSTKNLGELDVSGGLALDSYEAVTKNAKKPVIQAGKSADSLLVKLVTSSDTEKRMPLGASPLPPESIDVMRRWIDSGAKEGQRPADAAVSTAATPPPSRARKLEVVLPTSTTAPKGALGQGSAARLDLALKVGPLPPVTAVAFSPDGKLLAAGCYRQVTVWELASARPVKVLTSVLGAVNDVKFSPDGTLLAVAGGQPSAKGDLRLYQAADWKLLATLAGHEDVVFSVSFSPDGNRLASASFDKTVRVWDVAGHKAERTFSGHSDFVYAVAFSPDGKTVASASKDRSVRLTDVATGKGLFTFGGMDQDVLAVAFSPDGKAIVSSGFESSLHWWNPRTGERTQWQNAHSVAVHEICFSKDGKLVVTAGADKVVRVGSAGTGAALKSLTVGSSVYAAAIDPASKVVASGSYDGLTRLWDVASGRPLLTLLALPPRGEEPAWLALTPEGYTASSPDLRALAQWRVGGQAVAADGAWAALGRPEVVAKAARGETVPAPVFGR